jgi:Fic family protein
MTKYIYELPKWPKFEWDQRGLAKQLAAVRHRQGRLIGRMQELGFPLREEAALQTLTEDVLKSSEIEGEILDKDQVRSAIARRLGMEVAALPSADRNVEGVVEMMLDATQKYKEELTRDRLFAWHASLFLTGFSRRRTFGRSIRRCRSTSVNATSSIVYLMASKASSLRQNGRRLKNARPIRRCAISPI